MQKDKLQKTQQIKKKGIKIATNKRHWFSMYLCVISCFNL